MVLRFSIFVQPPEHFLKEFGVPYSVVVLTSGNGKCEGKNADRKRVHVLNESGFAYGVIVGRSGNGQCEGENVGTKRMHLTIFGASYQLMFNIS